MSTTIFTASTTNLRDTIIQVLCSEFPMTDLGHISSFLVVFAKFSDKGLFLSQTCYVEEIIERAGMKECKPCSTPVDMKSKLAAQEGKPLAYPTDYRSLAGALQYLTFTRPYISYAVQRIYLFMHDPRESHMLALKSIIRYFQGTKLMGLQLLKKENDEVNSLYRR